MSTKTRTRMARGCADKKAVNPEAAALAGCPAAAKKRKYSKVVDQETRDEDLRSQLRYTHPPGGMPQSVDEEEAELRNTYRPIYNPLHPRPVEVRQHHGEEIFCVQPFLGPLLFDNTDSDARDHCANERTFLSYLRLSIYMSIVSVAIIISFHLKNQPTDLELRMALPLGIIFWALGVACLAVGFGNYVKTVAKYSRRVALVQTGWKTQAVFTIIAISIVGVCVLFLSTKSQRS